MTAERAQKIASDEVPGVEWFVEYSPRHCAPMLRGIMPDGQVAGACFEADLAGRFRHEEGARVRHAAYDLAMAWCGGALR